MLNPSDSTQPRAGVFIGRANVAHVGEVDGPTAFLPQLPPIHTLVNFRPYRPQTDISDINVNEQPTGQNARWFSAPSTWGRL